MPIRRIQNQIPVYLRNILRPLSTRLRQIFTTRFMLMLLSFLLPLLFIFGINLFFYILNVPLILPIILAACDSDAEECASNSIEVHQRRPVLPATVREPDPFGSELMAAVEPFLNNDNGACSSQPSQSLSIASSESDNDTSSSSSMGEEAAQNAQGGPEAEAAGAPIPAFRAAHQAEEAELFDRIRRLEGMLGHQIITRLEPDGYLTEVQENLNSAADLGQGFYEECLEYETFELDIQEKKLSAQDMLFKLLLDDPNLRPDHIEISPFRDVDIREGAYEFVEEQLRGIREPCSVSDPTRKRVQREFYRSHLVFLINDLRAQERQSHTYRQFWEYFASS